MLSAHFPNNQPPSAEIPIPIAIPMAPPVLVAVLITSGVLLSNFFNSLAYPRIPVTRPVPVPHQTPYFAPVLES